MSKAGTKQEEAVWNMGKAEKTEGCITVWPVTEGQISILIICQDINGAVR